MTSAWAIFLGRELGNSKSNPNANEESEDRLTSVQTPIHAQTNAITFKSIVPYVKHAAERFRAGFQQSPHALRRLKKFNQLLWNPSSATFAISHGVW